ncbi:MAG: bifunctional ornithine acetyltransferase/N-acetylglutamate synthase, partial [Victivallales bacterium]|nr:bifunctional ornithine acetyltransferase/N-acetylglutamate synthase [Victivallales bacterium]
MMSLVEKGSVTSPKGFKASGVKAGLKRSGAPDMAMIYSAAPCVAAGAFTSNLFAAAPVVFDRERIAAGDAIHAVV